MLILKKDVRVTGIRAEILIALMAAVEACRHAGVDCIVTSGIEGYHSTASFHYAGSAIDIRTRHMSQEQAEQVVELLRQALTDDYDVVHERDKAPHIHIEFQPKRPLTNA